MNESARSVPSNESKAFAISCSISGGRLWWDDELKAHRRLRRRARTSGHEEPASGFARYAAARLSRRRRSSSVTGRLWGFSGSLRSWSTLSQSLSMSSSARGRRASIPRQYSPSRAGYHELHGQAGPRHEHAVMDGDRGHKFAPPVEVSSAARAVRMLTSSRLRTRRRMLPTSVRSTRRRVASVRRVVASSSLVRRRPYRRRDGARRDDPADGGRAGDTPARAAPIRFALARALWDAGGDRPRAPHAGAPGGLDLVSPGRGRAQAEIAAWLVSHPPR